MCVARVCHAAVRRLFPMARVHRANRVPRTRWHSYMCLHLQYRHYSNQHIA